MVDNELNLVKREIKEKAMGVASNFLDRIGFFGFPLRDKFVWRDTLLGFFNGLNNEGEFDHGFYYLKKYLKYVVKLIEYHISIDENLINVNNN